MPPRDDWKAFANLAGHVRLILLVDWDPIGVFGVPQAMDEYDNYVNRVISRLRSGATAADIADLLADIARTEMGCPLSGNTELAATKIVDIFQNDEEF